MSQRVLDRQVTGRPGGGRPQIGHCFGIPAGRYQQASGFGQHPGHRKGVFQDLEEARGRTVVLQRSGGLVALAGNVPEHLLTAGPDHQVIKAAGPDGLPGMALGQVQAPFGQFHFRRLDKLQRMCLLQRLDEAIML